VRDFSHRTIKVIHTVNPPTEYNTNNVVCGIGTCGKLTEQIFSEGKWHITGSLAYEPKSVIRSVLTDIAGKLFTGIEPTLLVISPLATVLHNGTVLLKQRPCAKS
jgi:hypothetical protein